MNALALAIIARLREAGATLECSDGGRVRFSAPTPIPAALLAEARQHREAIAAALASNAPEAPEPPEADAWGFTPDERHAALVRLRGTHVPVDGLADGVRTAAAAAGAQGALAWELRTSAALDGFDVPEPVPDWPEQERERLQSLNRKIANGYRRAALQRPPSWADPAALPSPGCFCSCCKGRRWWCEREAPKGWRCWGCHPPDHLAEDAVTEVRT